MRIDRPNVPPPPETKPRVTIVDDDERLLRILQLYLTVHGYEVTMARDGLEGLKLISSGRPDIVIPRLRRVIFVHGCYWHRHCGCTRATTPVRNRALWVEKFRATVARDKRNLSRLSQLGWSHLVLWECQIMRAERLEQALINFLAEGN